jgi:hypothetical protein
MPEPVNETTPPKPAPLPGFPPAPAPSDVEPPANVDPDIAAREERATRQSKRRLRM